jgi:hypothetical protein
MKSGALRPQYTINLQAAETQNLSALRRYFYEGVISVKDYRILAPPEKGITKQPCQQEVFRADSRLLG